MTQNPDVKVDTDEDSGKDPLQINHGDDTSTEQKLNLELNGTDLVTQNPDVKVDTDEDEHKL